jgi:hypothetical protein
VPVDQSVPSLGEEALAPGPEAIAGTAEAVSRLGQREAAGDQQQRVSAMADTRIGVGARELTSWITVRGQIHDDAS